MSIVLPDPRLEMPELFIPSRKPTGAVTVDWSHPISNGLMTCIMFGATYGAGVNLVNKATAVSGTAPVGAGCIVVSSASHIQRFAHQPSTDATILHVYAPISTVTANGYLSDFAGINEFAVIRGYQDGYYNIFGGVYPTGNASHTQMPMTALHEIDNILYAKKGSNLTGYINGRSLVNVTISTGKFSPSGDIKVGGSWAGSDASLGRHYATLVWNRGLTSPEARSITLNPYQFLIPA